MEMLIEPGGSARCIYGEELNLTTLGEIQIRRVSHVEPDPSGRWWADLSPIGGPRLGPFTHRSPALEAEIGWLRTHLPQFML